MSIKKVNLDTYKEIEGTKERLHPLVCLRLGSVQQVNQIVAETRMCGVGHTRAVPNLAIGLQDRRCDCLTQSCATQSRLGETQSRQGEAFLRRPNKPPSAHIEAPGAPFRGGPNSRGLADRSACSKVSSQMRSGACQASYTAGRC
ncbi:hypothetical protein VFPBJ_08559 [Purpureocillium lilacinum]|uniref:Uncharacterized protein n=1 Tax=Purpureocillium lilacinum TaxID=33203 RepID=A0A179GGE5_PURLI|nr:hypothetical protein VFPBJ_08559 [Purpureocillium lilacinum]